MLKFCSEFTPELEGLANVSAPQHLGIAERDYKAICAALGGFAPDKVAESIIKTEEEFGAFYCKDITHLDWGVIMEKCPGLIADTYTKVMEILTEREVLKL